MAFVMRTSWPRFGSDWGFDPRPEPREAQDLMTSATSERADLILALKRLIIRELDLRGRTEADIQDDAPLFGAGLGLDSLDALQLAMAVEQEYQVEVPEGEAAKSVFASVAALADHVQKSRGG
jgi:acyl carrier protein